MSILIENVFSSAKLIHGELYNGQVPGRGSIFYGRVVYMVFVAPPIWGIDQLLIFEMEKGCDFPLLIWNTSSPPPSVFERDDLFCGSKAVIVCSYYHWFLWRILIIISAIDCYQLPRCCLSISFCVFVLLVYLLWVSILMLSWPAWCFSFWLHVLPTVLMHRTLSIIFFTPVLHLIISFRILSLFVMFNNNLSMRRWATASFFSWFFCQSPCLCSIGHGW